jgi:hypothetical protein
MDLSDHCGKTPLLPPPSAEGENPGERQRQREKRSQRKVLKGTKEREKERRSDCTQRADRTSTGDIAEFAPIL